MVQKKSIYIIEFYLQKMVSSPNSGMRRKETRVKKNSEATCHPSATLGRKYVICIKLPIKENKQKPTGNQY